MHYRGLTPSEYARGARRQQGRITKTGHTHARRALVEGAWASRYPAQGSRHLPLRLEKRPTANQALSWNAPGRLCTRYRQLMARGKNAKQVVVAIARALSAFRWAMATPVPVLPKARGSWKQKLTGFARLSEEAQPRCGAILGSVTRPQGMLVPRVRQAPDGCQEGGSQPTDSSGITRRSSWLRLFR